jgi:hypothetical protein
MVVVPAITVVTVLVVETTGGTTGAVVTGHTVV